MVSVITTKELVRKNLYRGVIINHLLFSMTSPLISLYFLQRVSTSVFSIVNWISIVICLIMSKILKSQDNRDFLQKFFLPIILIDTLVFVLISFIGAYDVNVRFFGLAILNSTTSAIWMCIMRSNINRAFIGDELTNFQTHQDYLVSYSQFAGATIAIIITRFNVNINILMGVQILACAVMGYYDYKVIRIIDKIREEV